MRRETTRFRPPQGLLPYEQVVWVHRKRSAFLAGPPGLFMALFLLLLGGAFSSPLFFADSGSCRINEIPRPREECRSFVIAVGGVPLAIGLVLLGWNFAHRDIRYYLTTFRLVETRRGRIVKELSREVFRRKELSNFLQKSYTVDVTPPSLSVQIFDPRSGEVVMNFKDMLEEDVRELQSIAELVYCRYCGRKNKSEIAACTYCGASL